MNLKSIGAIIDSKTFDKVIYLAVFAISVAVIMLSHYKNAIFSVILGILSVPIVILVLIKLLLRMTCNPNKSNRLIHIISKTTLLAIILLLVFIEILVIYTTIKYFM